MKRNKTEERKEGTFVNKIAFCITCSFDLADLLVVNSDISCFPGTLFFSFLRETSM